MLKRKTVNKLDKHLIVLVGLPASGKSSTVSGYIKSLDEDGKSRVKVLSSDDIRAEITSGNPQYTGNEHKHVFSVLNQRAKIYLEDDETREVIYDATNLSRKKRIHLINNELKDFDTKTAWYLTKHPYLSMQHDKERVKSVGSEYMNRSFIGATVPSKAEGFDYVKYISNKFTGDSSPFESTVDKCLLELDRGVDEEQFQFITERLYREFNKFYNMDQNNNHHSKTLGSHLYHTYKNVMNMQGMIRKEGLSVYFHELILAAVLHDIGKYHTKEDLPGRSVYYRHENVSTQIAAHLICRHPTLLDKSVVLDLISYHMFLMDKNSRVKLKITEVIGDDGFVFKSPVKSIDKKQGRRNLNINNTTLELLSLLHLADVNAK